MFSSWSLLMLKVNLSGEQGLGSACSTSPLMTSHLTTRYALWEGNAPDCAIVDIEAVNPSDTQMMIGKRTMTVMDAKGIRSQGKVISAPDLKGLFRYFPGLGGIDNEPLLNRVRIQPGESVFGMVAARFEIPKHELDLRQELILRLVDVDGSVSEIRHGSEPSGASK